MGIACLQVPLRDQDKHTWPSSVTDGAPSEPASAENARPKHGLSRSFSQNLTKAYS